MSNFHTAITQFLSQQQVDFRLLMHSTPATSIEDAAQQRGCLASQMVKSMLLRDMGGRYALACVPGDLQADPKKVRAILQCRRMTCVSAHELENITGYSIGCVTPLLLPVAMPVFFDPLLLNHHELTISSGSNMAGIALKQQDLLQLCAPIIADITR